VTATALPDVEARIARHPVRTVPLPFGELAYRQAGSGPALVLLHGIGSGSASWVHQLDGLADRCNVVAWDAPGYGGSAALPVREPSADDYAGALAAFLDALGLGRVALLGHSLGAIVAGRFACAHPGRVARLVLLNPAVGYGSAPEAVRQQKYADRIAGMQKLGPERHARERVHHQLSAQASDAARELVIYNGSRLRPEGYAQAAWLLAHADLAADAARIDGDVLVACGSADVITPEAGARALAARFPRARYVSLPGLGHASYIEDPAAINQLLREVPT
jgi:pimeloyl-ACP methyl ester carboxylesterase